MQKGRQKGVGKSQTLNLIVSARVYECAFKPACKCVTPYTQTSAMFSGYLDFPMSAGVRLLQCTLALK